MDDLPYQNQVHRRRLRLNSRSNILKLYLLEVPARKRLQPAAVCNHHESKCSPPECLLLFHQTLVFASLYCQYHTTLLDKHDSVFLKTGYRADCRPVPHRQLLRSWRSHSVLALVPRPDSPLPSNEWTSIVPNLQALPRHLPLPF